MNIAGGRQKSEVGILMYSLGLIQRLQEQRYGAFSSSELIETNPTESAVCNSAGVRLTTYQFQLGVVDGRTCGVMKARF